MARYLLIIVSLNGDATGITVRVDETAATKEPATTVPNFRGEGTRKIRARLIHPKLPTPTYVEDVAKLERRIFGEFDDNKLHLYTFLPIRHDQDARDIALQDATRRLKERAMRLLTKEREWCADKQRDLDTEKEVIDNLLNKLND